MNRALTLSLSPAAADVSIEPAQKLVLVASQITADDKIGKFYGREKQLSTMVCFISTNHHFNKDSQVL